MFKAPEKFRVRVGMFRSDESYGNNGVFEVKSRTTKRVYHVIASDGADWEHVSVSLPDRCPSWEEMCKIKNLFWGEDECVIQYHPPKEDYVNNHPYCLHLWRPMNIELPRPPAELVGLK